MSRGRRQLALFGGVDYCYYYYLNNQMYSSPHVFVSGHFQQNNSQTKFIWLLSEISIIFQTIDERTISNSYIALDLYLVTNLMTLHFSKKTKEFHFIFFFFLLPNGLFVNWLVTCNPYSLFQVIELRPPETKNPILQRAANHANSHSQAKAH